MSHTSAWKSALRRAVTDVDELLALLALPPEALGGPEVAEGLRQLPLRVPRGFVARMRPGDPADPLLRQVLATAAESADVPGFGEDPLGERRAAGDGLLHKYRGRALLVLGGACAVHCRYCFRRHFPYAEASALGPAAERALARVAGDASIEEVILSGGDPLMLDDGVLAPLVARLEAVPHVRRLRVHTRMPVVLPERVDGALTSWLAACGLEKVVVIHANHAAELDATVAAAVGALRGAGATLLNQSVLLAGVNDRAETLAELSARLFAIGVLPYYLHLLDPVRGAAHFDVPEERAAALMRELSPRLPGYLVPRLVREVPGAPAKVPVPW